MDSKYAQNLVSILTDYQQRGYEWIVYDTINLKTTLQTFHPIEYRFKNNQIYYPLQISSLNKGQTQVDLVIITLNNQQIDFAQTDYPIKKLSSFSVKSADLAQLSSEYPDFFKGSDKLSVQHIRMSGDISKMRQDLIGTFTKKLAYHN
ncbi:MAG: hypothetical protein K1X44_05235 [Alphaproteobacteria bacterium]|nr:hypothetical protein [Alphaproteobacteria bacterium]